jgi:peptide/nickel transport system substrate-binding protein
MNLKSALLGAVCAFAMAPAAFAERGTDGEVKLTFPQAV